MGDKLLELYNQELAFIKQFGAEFASEHPKVAGRLKLSARAVEDPHVERLIEAFALLNARTRKKLDDDFPELINGIFSVAYPHYNAPIPSASIMQFEANKESLQDAYQIPKNVEIRTQEIEEVSCRFQTVYPVTLWPVAIADVKMLSQPLKAPDIINRTKVASALKIELHSATKDIKLSELAPNSLRFYINMQSQYSYKLYELIFNNIEAILLADSPNDPNPVKLPRSSLHAVGFSEEEGMLPYAQASFEGYRLLTEFFTFPEKFLFFELAELSPELWHKFTNHAELYLYFSSSSDTLLKQVDSTSLALGCTPIINIFTEHAEPIKIDHTQHEYELVANAATNQQAIEVYSIQEVSGTNRDGEIRKLTPYFGATHHHSGDSLYWQQSRKAAADGNHYHNAGSKVSLRFADSNFDPLLAEEWILDVKMLCTNRDLPSKLPFGGGYPKLHIWEHPEDYIEKINCISPMTRTLYPTLQDDGRWNLISHLSLNHLSLTNDNGLESLKEILGLYNFADSDDINNIIAGLYSLTTEETTVRQPLSKGTGFWHGTKITLGVDEDKFSGSGLYLFTVILARFLALYTRINTFTQLIIKGRRKGELFRCQPMTGRVNLL